MVATKKGNNILLLGFMGSGKTTLGKRLASKIDFDFLDTDQEIENQKNCSIKEIFAYQGEDYFRALETEQLESLVKKGIQKTVISLGGGIILKDENWSLFKHIGRVVYLKTDLQQMYKRVAQKDHRPLISGKNNNFSTFQELFRKREKLYEKADVIFECDSPSVVSLVEKLVDLLNEN